MSEWIELIKSILIWSFGICAFIWVFNLVAEYLVDKWEPKERL